MKVYAIKDRDGTLRLVKARSKHHAMRHCKYTAKVATQDELIDWLQAGKEIEQSTANYFNDETDDTDPRQIDIEDAVKEAAE